MCVGAFSADTIEYNRQVPRYVHGLWKRRTDKTKELKKKNEMLSKRLQIVERTRCFLRAFVHNKRFCARPLCVYVSRNKNQSVTIDFVAAGFHLKRKYHIIYR